VAQDDSNSTDVSSVRRQGREDPIFGVRPSLGIDGVALADDRNAIHAEDRGKPRANFRTNSGSISGLRAQERRFERKGAASG
jgi:hypothetical protein